MPTVCVGVPVWRGAEYVGETLDSLLRQRGVALAVVVSVDGADEASVAACRPFLSDPRVALVVQPQRLGWVGNSSAVLAQAASQGTEYACLQPYDDVLDDDYLAILAGTSADNPAAAVVYSDIQGFGAHDIVIRQATVAGSPFERQLCLLRDHFAAAAFRGLMRVSTLRSIIPIAGNRCDDFAADTVWMARQALAGDLLRVPLVLYRKRYHATNTHLQWGTWSYERRMTAWITHCLDMLAEALKATTVPRERRMLHEAALTRVMHRAAWTTPLQNDHVAMSRLARIRLGLRFATAAMVHAGIGPSIAGFRAGLRAMSARQRFRRRGANRNASRV
jgi:glycosyltransferase involved in cell wall biosynthesis